MRKWYKSVRLCVFIYISMHFLKISLQCSKNEVMENVLFNFRENEIKQFIFWTCFLFPMGLTFPRTMFKA